MAEPTATNTPKPAIDVSSSDAVVASRPKPAKEASSTPVQIALRVALGFSGLALLVGFFLPWLQHDTMAGVEGAPAAMVSTTGLSLATSGDLGGSPAMLLFLIPALGIALSAISFMGFKWSGQVAVGIALTLIGYALYVLLQMFVQHTALGLWVVAGGTFVVLLLGVIAWMTGRDRRPVSRPEASTSDKKA